MPIPTDLPSWATDVNYTNGDDAGTNTKVAAPTAFRNEGWVKNDPVVAQYLNEWQNNVGLWVDYLERRNRNVIVDSIGEVTNNVASDYTPFASFTIDNSNYGNLQIGDVVEANFYGAAWTVGGVSFNIDAWITENAGSQVLKTPGSGNGNYGAISTNLVPIMLSFAHVVENAGPFQIILKSRTSNVANTLTIYNTSHIIKIHRLP